jgi:hypothetical protein
VKKSLETTVNKSGFVNDSTALFFPEGKRPLARPRHRWVDNIRRGGME